MHPIATVLILFLFFSFVHTCIANVECLSEQSSSLLHLKEELSIPHYKLASWQLESNCCNWEGVICDSETGRVISLDLSMHNISGTVGDSLFNLTSLENLNLAYNQIGSVSFREKFERLVNLTQLNLSNTGFTGAIAEEIFQLRNLTVLDLSDNQMLSGSLPDFQKNSTLQTLLLSNTKLSGNLTESIGNLKSLIKLDVSGCQFSGQVPDSIGSLYQLVHLDLSFNNFTSAIPRSLFKLSGLQYLALAWNNFRGVLKLDLLYSLSNLSYLDLSYNKLSIVDGEVNSSISLPRISTMKLASCNLINIPFLLRYQDNMTTLDLSNNRIDGGIPKWIWHIGNQTLVNMNLSYNLFTHIDGSNSYFLHTSESLPISLDLNSNMLQGPIPLPPRETILLDYSNNNFSSVIPLNISFYLNSTIFFSLANNSLTGEIPPSICHARTLQVLDLSDNLLSGPIPSCILKHSKDLTVLNLRGNKLRGTIPQKISKRCGLKTLNLNGNYLEGGVPLSLDNCNDLEVIDFGNNQIVDSFPFWLGGIYVLRILVLRSNGFYGTIELPSWIPHNNYTFTKLQILDVSSNHFTGRLPADCFPNLKAMTVKLQPNSSIVGEFVYSQQTLSRFQGFFYQDTVVVTSKGRDNKLIKILTIFNYIDFSNNSFEGDIPDVIGGLHSLYVLNFSHNQLTGRIPSTFGNLTQLESLDLSANHLSGEIPQGLTLLTFLSFLNLSDNNFEGSIPQGNQFSTFTNTSYQGNKDLCGSPLSKQCRNASPASTNTNSASSESDRGSSEFSYDIGLALAVGLGYGFGITLVFVIQTMPARQREKVKRWLLAIRRREWHSNY